MEKPIEAIGAGNETVRIAQDLIRINTSNYGPGDAVGEDVAAEYVSEILQKLELAPVTIEPAPKRTSVVCRVEGHNQNLPPLVVHGHLDVVPADEPEWQVDPFGGLIRDGYLWGRGAVDMKNMDAMILSSVAALIREGDRPKRDLIIAFFADEETGGGLGSKFVVENHPNLFAGATHAISEVGGYSIDIKGRSSYLIQTGEKALVWLQAKARGKAAHGSRFLSESAILRLVEGLERLRRHTWEPEFTATTVRLLQGIADTVGVQFSPDSADDLVRETGFGEGFIASSLRTTANPTTLRAGNKHNVVPNSAEASIDVRTLPGMEDAVLDQLQTILGKDIEIEIVYRDIGFDNPFEGELVERMTESILSADPGAIVLPYLMPAGTDNKALALLGIAGYGFVPMKLPKDFDFASMFHGVDERIPLSALSFGHGVLRTLFETY
jgi:acetylornithine deacetylase/succinyl-diaminopimelate desuccinylase-like protein